MNYCDLSEAQKEKKREKMREYYNNNQEKVRNQQNQSGYHKKWYKEKRKLSTEEINVLRRKALKLLKGLN